MTKKLTTKTLDGIEFKLEEAYPIRLFQTKKKHQPAQIIIPFISFGIGTKINFNKIVKESVGVEIGGEFSDGNAASVTAFYEEGDKIIIEAEKETKKEEKMKFVNKIVRKLNFNEGLSNKTFIDMLSNVFTDKQLQEFMNEKDLEIILFDGLMYLKVGDKAYRL